MLTGDALTSHTFTIELGTFQVETLKDVSGLTVGQDVVEIRQVSPTGELIVRKQPGVRQAGEVTLTRGMDKSTAFTDWIRTSLQGDLDGARQNVTIAVSDAAEQPVRRFHLVNAWASSWTGPDLDATASGPATETVTLTYEDISVE
ncbi:phage tail protein [Streptomyces sp. NPDC048595]|uniref:phage tail protein n=1 Tax=Streptomyces sp. NPDC048595 TaxID=3365576 RepID=UPI0037226098